MRRRKEMNGNIKKDEERGRKVDRKIEEVGEEIGKVRAVWREWKVERREKRKKVWAKLRKLDRRQADKEEERRREFCKMGKKLG